MLSREKTVGLLIVTVVLYDIWAYLVCFTLWRHFCESFDFRTSISLIFVFFIDRQRVSHLSFERRAVNLIMYLASRSA